MSLLPKSKEVWKIKVDGGEEATARSILDANLYFSLLEVDDEGDLAMVCKQCMAGAKKAYERHRAAGGMKGLRRVDFLGDYRWFRGIHKECDEHRERFCLLQRLCSHIADLNK